MWEELYRKRLEFYVLNLKSGFLQMMEKAIDKEYAKNLFRENVFENCPYIPMQSIFFDQLIDSFIMYQKLGYENYLDKTLALVDELRSDSYLAVEQAFIVLTGMSQNATIESLPKHYQQQISAGDFILDELINAERYAIGLSDEDLVELLAHFQAGNILSFLLDEHEQKQTIQQQDVKLYKKPVILNCSRNKQALLFHYFFEVFEITRLYTDLKSMVKFVVDLLNIEYTTVEGSEMYKKISNPLAQTSQNRTIKNLEFIRTYFESVNCQKVLPLIDRDIKDVRAGKYLKP
ncbi:MAG: hypothetical protein ACO1O6_01770 [Bacteroidota bacterium]